MKQKESDAGGGRAAFWERAIKYILPIGTGLLLLLHIVFSRLLSGPQWLSVGMGLGAVLIGSYPILKDVFICMRSLRISVDVLVAIAVTAAVVVGHYMEAGTVLFIHLLGELLESIAVNRAKRDVHDLLNLIPEKVRVKRKHGEEEIPLSKVKAGDIIVVRPGERIGVDGVVVAGYAAVDQSLITGESMPIDKSQGDTVYTGTLNTNGAIQVEAIEVGEETKVAGIKTLIEKAKQDKPPIQRIADRFAVWYVPAILAVAVIIRFVTGDILRSITLLVVACPCALVLGPPIAVVAAIGNAARRGILVKSGAALEMCGRLNRLVFDKTGTLTHGKPEVVATESLGCRSGHGKKEILRLAAIAEKLSEHPLAHAVTRQAAEMGLEVPDPEGFSLQAGQGIKATHKGVEIILGSREYLQRNALPISREVDGYMREREARGETVLLMAHNDGKRVELCGAISVADTVRENAFPAVSELIGMDIGISMHTGDNRRTARAIAGVLGIEQVSAELLPDEKVAGIETLRKQGFRVAMVGDGINDAPSLAAAEVGMAMGACGADVSVDVADVVIMTDDLGKVPQSVRLGKSVLRTIRQDIVFAVVFNMAVLFLASSGMINMVVGAVLHQVSSLLVAANSLRILLFNPDKTKCIHNKREVPRDSLSSGGGI